MERLTLAQARERLETILSHRLCRGAPRLTIARMIDWSAPGDSANDVERSVDDVLPPLDMRREIADVLRAYQAHLDYEAGRAAALAGPPDAVVKPGDHIQDMEMFHRFNGQVRILCVERVGDKDGRPAAVCSSSNGDKATIRLDRIHRKNIKTGWRVLDAAEGA